LRLESYLLWLVLDEGSPQSIPFDGSFNRVSVRSAVLDWRWTCAA